MEEYFKNKKVIITGHTGFKGSWLSLWLKMLGAKVYGISISIPTKPSHFELLDLNFFRDIRFDIFNSEKVIDIVSQVNPDYIFHLAAQPLVGLSYEYPLQTFNTNTIGTANILESLRRIKKKCIAIFITSDKSYDNLEINRGYHEEDKLGGADPYSGSKGAAELIISSYLRSFFHSGGNIKLGIGRAGNVIGGGDWANKRIIPDIIKSLESNKTLKIRNLMATRPWQHVLEPISGYLSLAVNLMVSDDNHGESFNFGPSFNSEYTVEEVLFQMKKYFEKLDWEVESSNNFKESRLLKLDCKKAMEKLSWKANLNFDETIRYTSEWYKEYFSNKSKFFEFSQKQIINFISEAKSNKIQWTKY